MFADRNRALVFVALVFAAGAAQAGDVSLEAIMADPDWMGRPPQRAYWADDGRSIYYYHEREGEDDQELIQIDLEGNPIRTVPDSDRGLVDDSSSELSPNRLRKAYSRNGDLFVKDLATGRITQLTRTSAGESSPRFLANNDHLAFNRGDTIVVRDLASDLEYDVAELRASEDPAGRQPPEGFMVEQQRKLLETIRTGAERREKSRERGRARAEADATRLDAPYYLGANLEIVRTVLLPREDYLLVVVRDSRQARESRRTIMPNYVTESGDVTTRNVRAKVGTGRPVTDELRLIDLHDRKIHKLDLGVLPGIEDDPLAALAKENEAKSENKEGESADEEKDAAQSTDEGTRGGRRPRTRARTVSVRTILPSDDGRGVVVQFGSHDNKDRWLTSVNLTDAKLVPIYRETNPAWINSRSGIQWLPDHEHFIYLSEETGYSHLYLANAKKGQTQALTYGEFEVSSPELSQDGKYVYFRANREHPGIYEIFRVAIESSKIEQLTKLGGSNTFELSPNESHLLLTHSETTRHGELYVQPNEPGASARRLTRTMDKEFTSIDWIKPEIVAVPSTSGKPVYSRLYVPADGSHKSGPPRPAVFFIHGAGYLQDAHHGWSSYTREFMFHTLLVQRGYVVLDMDYRGSAGYGAAWRTAIYREMGKPEVEDLADGVAWLAKEHNVDPKRVGCYGGSYGGFLTLMALFTKPELFACGAALRPVTDWAHYNHGYTANILNVPSIDPEAYERSSPIYFAEGLAKPLLICHGMQDDNVFFEDSVRLVQRLIELKKENWELAIYPVEPHGFRVPSSWLDEYRRILKLFETHLQAQ